MSPLLRNLTGYFKLLPFLSLCISLTATPAHSQVNVLTQHNDNQRSGANLSETKLTTANVNVNGFGKLFTCPVDGHIYAQPLYVANLAISGGTHNVVYVATAHDSVYAFDADSGGRYWSTSLGTPVPSSVINTPNIPVEVGIISTPVIDNTTNTIYVVTKTYENSVQIFRLHALDITTGAEKLGGPVVISAQVNGSGDGGSGGVVPFVASKENQRSALTLANGNVYVAFASHEDYSPYHGWILSYNKTNLAQNAVFNDTPNGAMGGIWMAGQGPAVDASGNLYVMTGNGTSDAQTSGLDYGECFLKLSPSLGVLDWFMPSTFASLNAADEDLGSAGPMLIPGTNDIIGGGKSGVLYLLNLASLGRYTNGSDLVTQEWQGVSLTQPGSHHIHGAPVYYNGANGAHIYVWGENDNLRAYAFNGASFNSTASSVSSMLAPQLNVGMPGGALSVSANGTVAGSGIVWATTPSENDALHAVVSGVVRAFDAGDISRELWNSRQNQARDDIGVFAKNVAPVVDNGKVYVATFGKELAVYGLNPPSPVLSRAISVDFVGGGGANGTPASLAASESGGVVPLTNWNNAAGATGSLTTVVDNAGVATGASVAWTAAGTWSTPVAETAGNARMMKGYLDTSGSGNTTTVTVSNLPAQFTSAPYTVYVYFDGDNGGAWRTGSYTIGSTTINGVDMGINYGGLFARAVNSEGNYIAFTNVSGSSFSLKAVGIDDIFRAPINGIQIVENVTAPTSIPSVPSALSAVSGSQQVTLNWAASAGAASYNVYRSTTAGGEGTTPIVTGITSTNYINTGLTNGTAYFYKVAAVNSLGTSAQSTEALATPSSAAIVNGTYEIANQYSGLSIDDPHGGGTGALIDQQPYGSVNQQWNVTLVSGNNYKITSVVNGLALAGPTVNAQLVLQAYTGATNQLWTFTANGSHYKITNVASGQVIDNFGPSGTAGTVVGQWGANGGYNQNWTLVPVIAAGGYKVINRLSGLALDDPGGAGIGAALIQWGYNGGTNQQWKVVPAAGGYYTIQCVANNLVASVNGSTTPGAGILLETYSAGNDQLWTITKLSDGYYLMMNKMSWNVMDDSGGSLVNNNPIVEWPWGGGTNQEWSFQAP